MNKDQLALYLEQTIIWNIHDLLLDYVDKGEFGVCLERKAMVANLSKIGKVEVYSDHEPKHFHIKSERLDLKFKIDNLEQIQGEQLNSKQKKNSVIKYFLTTAKDGKNYNVTFYVINFSNRIFCKNFL